MGSSDIKETGQPFPQRQQGSDTGVLAPAARSCVAGVACICKADSCSFKHFPCIMKSVYSLLMIKISSAPIILGPLWLCLLCESLRHRKISFWCAGSHSGVGLVRGGWGAVRVLLSQRILACTLHSGPGQWGRGDEALLPSGAYMLEIKYKQQPRQDALVPVRTTSEGRNVGQGASVKGTRAAPHSPHPQCLPGRQCHIPCSSWWRPAPGPRTTRSKAPGQGEPGST